MGIPIKSIPCACFFALLLGHIAGSCKGSTSPLTEEDRKMVPVLADAHIAEAGMEAIPDRAVKDSLAGVWYGQIFEIHDLDKATFEDYLQRLSKDTDRMNAVYDTVQAYLKRQGK